MSEPLAEFAQRLSYVVREKGGMTAVAAGADVPLSTLARWVRAESEPSAFKLAAIARFCGVTVEELIYGLGSFPKLSAGFSVSPQDWQPSSAALPQPDSGIESDDDVVFIPLLEVIASAGPGIENSNPVAKDVLPFPRRWLEQLNLPAEFARFLDSRGDSMTETIKEDAICLADTRWQRPRLDAIFVVVHNNDVRIKRIGRGMEGRVTLISDNPRYETEVLSEPEARSLKIAGRVVWAGGKI